METKAINLLSRLLEAICTATGYVEKVDTDAGLTTIPEFRWSPIFEFYKEDIEIIKWIQNKEGLDFSQLINK